MLLLTLAGHDALLALLLEASPAESAALHGTVPVECPSGYTAGELRKCASCPPPCRRVRTHTDTHARASPHACACMREHTSTRPRALGPRACSRRRSPHRARRTMGIRMTLPTAERCFWHCGAHTAEAKPA